MGEFPHPTLPLIIARRRGPLPAVAVPVALKAGALLGAVAAQNMVCWAQAFAAARPTDSPLPSVRDRGMPPPKAARCGLHLRAVGEQT
jgi:hypothetical protein